MKQYNKSIRGKLFKYFKQRLNIKKSTNGWYRSDCVYCGAKFTMGLNLQQKRFKCHRCEEKSNPIKLLMDLERFNTINEVWTFLNLQEEYEAYREEIVESHVRKEVKLPESFKLLTHRPKELLGQIAYDYLIKKRKFKPTDLLRKGVGYCTSGEYDGFIIFPFYKRGELKFFQGRKYSASGFSKMKNPPLEEFGIGKTELIYNEDALYIYRKINIVESITNAITLGDNTIAILGKSISPYQLKTILSSPCEYIDILLDSDAYDKTIQLALQLCQYKYVKVIKMPDEKDVNDLGRRRTIRLKKKERYGDYNIFIKKKLENATNTINTYN